MGIKMAGPARIKKGSSIYYFRLATPAELRRRRNDLIALGITKALNETCYSLRTSDYAEAKRLWDIEKPKCLCKWEEWKRLLAAGPHKLTEKEISAISADIWRGARDWHSHNPGSAFNWRVTREMFEMLAPPRPIDFSDPPKPSLEENPIASPELQEMMREKLRLLGYTSVTPESFAEVMHKFWADLSQIAGSVESMANDDYSEPVALQKRPKLSDVRPLPPVPFKKLIDRWKREANPAPQSVDTYRGYFKRLAEHLGHDDARKVTKKSLVEWKEAMINLDGDEYLSGKDIREKLRAVRQLITEAYEVGLLEGENPARDRIKVNRKDKCSSPDEFSGAQQVQILRAAKDEKRAIIRWAPIIGAYTGMRIGEIAQLRPADVREDDDGWQIIINKDAGGTKTKSSERVIPVHAALISAGFVEHAAQCRTQRLFPDVWQARKQGDEGKEHSRAAGRASQAVSRWVRGLPGFKDAKIAPDHSWRHSFRTALIGAGVPDAVIGALLGHAPSGVTGRYGSVSMKAKRRAIEALPVIAVESSLGPQGPGDGEKSRVAS